MTTQRWPWARWEAHLADRALAAWPDMPRVSPEPRVSYAAELAKRLDVLEARLAKRRMRVLDEERTTPGD